MKKVNKKGLTSKNQQTQAQLEEQKVQQQKMQQKAQQQQQQQQQSLAQSIQTAMQEDGYTIEDVVMELRFNDVQDQEIFQALSELGYNQNQIVALLQEKQTETPTADSLYKAQKIGEIISGSKDGSYHQRNADGSITVMDNWGTVGSTRKELDSALLQAIINRQMRNYKPVNNTNPFFNFYQQNYIPSTINTYPSALGRIGMGLSRIFGGANKDQIARTFLDQYIDKTATNPKNWMQTGGPKVEDLYEKARKLLDEKWQRGTWKEEPYDRAEELRIRSDEVGKYAQESFENVKGKFLDEDVTYQYVRKIPNISDTPTSLPNKTNDIPTINLTEGGAEGLDDTRGMSKEMVVDALKRMFIDPVTRVGQDIYDVGEDVAAEAMREKPEIVAPEEEPPTPLDVNQILDVSKTAVSETSKDIYGKKESDVPPEEREYNFENKGFRTKKSKIQATEKYKDLLNTIRKEEYPEVPLPVLMSIMAIESAGNVKGDSGAAKGLMQITRGTWSQRNIDRKKAGLKTYKYDDYKYDPEINVLYGIETLKAKAKKLGISPSDENYMDMVIAAYNGGEGIVGDAIKFAKSKGQDGNKDWLLLENMIPAVAKYDTWEYYYNQRGKSRNKYIDKRTGKPIPNKEGLAKKEAIRLKAKEISDYPYKFKAYLKYFGKYYKQAGGENALPKAQIGVPKLQDDDFGFEDPFDPNQFQEETTNAMMGPPEFDYNSLYQDDYIPPGLEESPKLQKDDFGATKFSKTYEVDPIDEEIDMSEIYDAGRDFAGSLKKDNKQNKFNKGMNTFADISGGIVDVAAGLNYLFDRSKARAAKNRLRSGTADQYSAVVDPKDRGLYDENTGQLMIDKRASKYPRYIRSTGFAQMGNGEFLDPNAYYPAYGNPMYDFFMDNELPMYQGEDRLNETQDSYYDFQSLPDKDKGIIGAALREYGVDDRGYFNMNAIKRDRSISDSQRQILLGHAANLNRLRLERVGMDYVEEPVPTPKRKQTFLPTMYTQSRVSSRANDIPVSTTPPFSPEQYAKMYEIMMKRGKSNILSPIQGGPMFQEQKRYGGSNNPFMRSKILRKKGGQVAKVSSSVLSKLIAKGANIKEI